jgi:RNA polymerase sigma factor (sigma-70 family)
LPDDTPQLTRDIASGNPEAFAQLYRARFDEMYRWARRATGRDEAFCLDVVQDAMMRIIRSLKPLQSERQLRGYLRAATQSCALDRLRSERRRRERERRAAGARHMTATLRHSMNASTGCAANSRPSIPKSHRC